MPGIAIRLSINYPKAPTPAEGFAFLDVSIPPPHAHVVVLRVLILLLSSVMQSSSFQLVAAPRKFLLTFLEEWGGGVT